MIKMILCSDVTGAIGKDNDLLFHIKEDMEYCLYSFAEGKLTAIDTHMDDNILIGETGSIENIVVLIRPEKINWIFTVILSVAGAGILLIIFSFGRKAVMKRNNLK